MRKKVLDLLRAQGITCDKGLLLDEIQEIEKIYEIQFPYSLKSFLMSILPISKGFYNWRDMGTKNVEYIKEVIEQPIHYIYHMPEEIDWCDEWGVKPDDKLALEKEVRERSRKAPKLIPVFSHRYMPMVPLKNPPIISVCNADIIYYGKNIKDYFMIEFGGKSQTTITLKGMKAIPFWSDIM